MKDKLRQQLPREKSGGGEALNIFSFTPTWYKRFAHQRQRYTALSDLFASD
jgi:hypothetical protein